MSDLEAENAKLEAELAALENATPDEASLLPNRTGDIVEDDKREVGAVLDTLRATQHQVEETMGNGYWLTLVFASPSQREEFVAKSGWKPFADEYDTYYDGIGVAESLGVALTPAQVRFREDRRDRRLVEEVGLIEDVP